jgi:hypothetical protein
MRWSLWAGAVAPAAIAVSACGCGPNNQLTGSVDELLSIAYDFVKLVKQGNELGVEYLAYRDDGGLDKICILVLDTSDLPLDDDTAISGDLFDERVTLRRAVRAEDDFPEIEHGRLELTTIDFRDGGDASGKFTVVFVGGRTLEGSFGGMISEREF